MSDNIEREPVVVKKSRFLGVTKIQFLALGLFILIALVSILGFFIARRVADNAKTLNFICSTTKILDEVVVDAHNQSEKNFKNGTYAHLLKIGVISQANIDAARRTLKSYELAHEVLKANGSCR